MSASECRCKAAGAWEAKGVTRCYDPRLRRDGLTRSRREVGRRTTGAIYLVVDARVPGGQRNNMGKRRSSLVRPFTLLRFAIAERTAPPKTYFYNRL